MASSVVFEHRNYVVLDERITRKPDAPPMVRGEEEEVIKEMARYVEARIIGDFGFIPINIPDDSDDVEDEIATSSILVSPNWQEAEKLLIIIQNASGSLMGIFSRSFCLDKGLNQGSMLPYIQRATESGFAVMILRPNTNSVVIEGSPPTKKMIRGSESPEFHALFVWENIVSKLENVRHIALLGYGNGAYLCKDIFLRQMARSKQDDSESFKIRAFVTLEASKIIEDDDAEDIRNALGNMAVNMECNSAPIGYRLVYRKEKLGCTTISLGMPEGEITNVAASIALGLDPVFRYLHMAETSTRREGDVGPQFAKGFALYKGFDGRTAEVTVNPDVDEISATGSVEGNIAVVAVTPPTPPPQPQGFFSRIFGSSKRSNSIDSSKSNASTKSSGSSGGASQSDAGGNPNRELAVSDFHLLKVVGKGAFGKVMLVRKKAGTGEGSGQVYAMKVLKKSVVAAKGQIEHTKSERSILCEIRHPYIVRLRFAFQSEDKLYMVTDYYNGGTLFYHLRKAGKFNEDRAQFYAAELLSALGHLHQQHIIYRDLKLENILMSHDGHIALTDFGLSKQGVDESGGATTFCGTAEYIAPELLKNQPYGPAVDWWSFGILIYEMLQGRTPFYDKNRKLMFYRIVHTAPSFTTVFSPAACETIRGLLVVDTSSRLGSGEGGARAIMESPFFANIDFKQLFDKEIPPPFMPEVVNELDTKYVPKAYLMAQAEDSFSETKKGEKLDTFEEFTFSGESALK